MACIGIIDCGSNTIRLCIWNVKDKFMPTTLSGVAKLVGAQTAQPAQTTQTEQTTPPPGPTTDSLPRKKDLKTLLNHKVMAGMAAHIHDGILDDEGIKKAAKIIREQLARAEYFECDRLEIFATAFLRNCKNRAEAQAQIEADIDYPLTVLTDEEESHLGFIGAKSAELAMGEGVLMDIGGGSCELTRVQAGKDYDNISIPIGSLSSFSKHVAGILPTRYECASIARDMRHAIMGEPIYSQLRVTNMWGVGGSVRAIAKVRAELFHLTSTPSTLSLEEIDELIRWYERDYSSFSHLAIQAVPDRIHTLIPGMILASEIMHALSAEKLTICKGGVREGYAIARIIAPHAQL